MCRFALVLGMLSAAALYVPIPEAHAQAYPSRPITLVVPFAAGGGIDLVARLVAENLQKKLQQPVIVENRAGAGGIIGTSFVARAVPDGYTLLFIEASSVLAKWFHKEAQFDVRNDLAPVGMVATNYLGLFANNSVPANDIKQLISYSKANPGKLSVGTPGVGTPHYLAALMLDKAAGINISHVSYRGTSASVRDLIGGQIPLVWGVPVNAMPYVEKGNAKVLGISSPRRLRDLPAVPAVAETVPGFEVTLWLGIAAPAKTPDTIVSHLSNAIGEILHESNVQQRITKFGYAVDFRSAAEFSQMIAADQKRFGAVIREAGIATK